MKTNKRFSSFNNQKGYQNYLWFVLLLGVMGKTMGQSKSDSVAKFHGTLGVFSGCGVPVLDYASSNVYKYNACWTKTGFNIGAFYEHGIAKHIEIVDQEKVNQNYPGYNIMVTSDPWKFKSMLIGLQYSLRPIKQFSVGIHAMPGIMWATYPQLVYSVNPPQTAAYSVTVIPNDSKAFSYLIGMYFRYKFNSAFSVLFKADYIGSTQTFEDVRSGGGMISNYDNGLISKSIQVVNLSLGLGVGID